MPEDYIRKQTLTNCERYITQELKELENRILGAQRPIRRRWNTKLFDEVRKIVAAQLARVQTTATAVASWTCCAPLPQVSVEQRLLPGPVVNLSGKLYIKDSRHPVVEAAAPGRALCPQRRATGHGRQPGGHHHRPQHGGQVHLYAADCPDRASWRRSAALSRPPWRRSALWTASSPASAPPTTWPRASPPLWWR